MSDLSWNSSPLCYKPERFLVLPLVPKRLEHPIYLPTYKNACHAVQITYPVAFAHQVNTTARKQSLL